MTSSEADNSEVEISQQMKNAPQIPRYKLEEEIGSGGMSIVYRAFDGNLGREVAVKVLHRHLSGRREERKRFRREAQAVARLRHPNILEIHDYSDQDATDAYIVSEFIRGPTLRDFAETVGFGLPEIGAMVAERLACALTHAHSQGVIHRDVKPENVMIQDDGTIKLTDFGIAQMVDRDERMTQTGALLGSPAHMPPEIIAGEDLDHRVDIFSLGTVLYWLACGSMPFTGSSPAEILRRIVESDYPDPRILDPRVSDPLAAIIMKAMARQPGDRYATAAEMQTSLADYLEAQGFDRPELELAAFFADPPTYKRTQRSRLIETLLGQGRDSAQGRDFAPAIAAFDRVLAIQPGHEGAKDAVGQLRRQKARRTGATRILGGVTSAAVAAAFVFLLPWEHLSSKNEQTPGDLLEQPTSSGQPSDDTEPAIDGDAALPDVHQKHTKTATDSPQRASLSIDGSLVKKAALTAGREGSTQQESSSRGPETQGSEDDPRMTDSALAKEPSALASSRGRERSKRPAGVKPPVTPSREPAPGPPDSRVVRILLDTWAEISIDDKRLERDREARPRLSVGRHRLSIRREGFVPIEEEIEVPPGDEMLELRHRLIPRPATVRVVNEQNVAVSLNGKLIGTATSEGFEVPITFSERPDGRFEYPTTAVIRLEKPGYMEQIHELRLRPGQVEKIVARLEPEG